MISAPFEIVYHPDVSAKDLPKLSGDVKSRIRQSIETKLTKAPEEFGVPLRRTLKGYWKLRVGDYRVIYKVSDKIVIVFRIGHRKEIYQQ
jgi:mRNA interferase RelE/StbE